MIELDESLLPGVLQDFVQMIGLASTLKLVETYGGTRLYVPKNFSAEHSLVKLIGAQATRKLADGYGGEDHFDIPKAEAAIRAIRDAKIRASESSQRLLALEYNLTERQIRNIQANAVNDAQPELF